MDLYGAGVLVTRATGGIGRTLVRALAERGGDMILTARRADLPVPLAAEAGGPSPPTSAIPTRSSTSWRRRASSM